MNDRDFRLSKNVRPVRYDLHIDVDLEAWRFAGKEAIEVTIEAPTRDVWLHTVELEILRARALTPDGRASNADLVFNDEAETVTLKFDDPLPPGPARLEVEFRGEIRERLRGFYRSHKDGARYAATQFEAADARRAFPCFDEPEFKARFALTLTIPAETVAISNGAIENERGLTGKRKEVRFAETPPISPYLVAYTVGPYEATPVAMTASGVPTRVFLPTGMAAKGIYARDAHVRSLDYLEAYTAIPYPYGKLDAIGVPDFEAGAMENPGAITYRLTAIAADEEHASTPALKSIFYTAAHELTHMWWGDMVTMAWWDDLWLNESFATFIGYKVVAELMPDWGLWRDFVATLTRPFNLDALVSTHPISFEVKNAKQATERFDVITYWKGAGVVRMIAGFLGAEAFRDGVRAYLERYRERNAVADDFWRELSAASQRDVAMIANAWIKQPGHPLVSIEASPGDGCTSLTLRQERFYADPDAGRREPPVLWPVPMVLKYGTDEGVATRPILLTKAEQVVTLPASRWVYPNGDAAGFYRFALDGTALTALAQVAQSVLSPQERLALVGNQWALVKADKAPIAEFFALLQGFRKETDRAVLSAITERLSWLETHVLQDHARSAFEQYVAGFYSSHMDGLGWDAAPEESTDDRMRRAMVISALGGLARLQEVTEEAQRRLERYMDDRSSLDPNLASVVADLTARSGDADLYERFLARKRASAQDPEEEQRFLFALASFEDEGLIRRTLELVLTEDVRPQDSAHLLARLLAARPSRMAAWSFVRTRWTELIDLMDPMLQQNLIRALAQLTPEPAASEVRSFLPPRASNETRETVAQAMEQLTIESAACKRLARALTEVF
jgi:puromycin-sensitive aminopeptidase